MQNNDFVIDDQLNYNNNDFRTNSDNRQSAARKSAKEDGESIKIAEAKRKWKKLQKFAKDGREFVLLIGLAGAAKTVITTSIVYASMKKHGVMLKDLRKPTNSAGYLSKMITALSAGSFPAATGVFDLEYYDTTIYYNGKTMPIIFIEMSGENLARFNPEDDEKNAFFNGFTDFLQLNPSLSTFLVAPANHKAAPPDGTISAKVSNLDLFFQMCINHLYNINERLTHRMGLIISKWDTLGDKKVKLKDFIRKNYPITWQHFIAKNNIDHSNYFKFSVGKVSADGSAIEGELQLQDCYPILDWIHDLVVKCPMVAELGKIENVINKVDVELGNSNKKLEDIQKNVEGLGINPKINVSWKANILRKIAQLFII